MINSEGDKALYTGINSSAADLNSESSDEEPDQLMHGISEDRRPPSQFVNSSVEENHMQEVNLEGDLPQRN